MCERQAPTTAGAVYAAIASLSPAQQTMLTEISKHSEPVTVTELAANLHLHPNSVRTTLDSLSGLNLIDRQVLKSGGRGRPSWGYFTMAPDSKTFATTQLVELTDVFCDMLRENFDDPVSEAHRIGRTWGNRVVEQISNDTDFTAEASAEIDIDTQIAQMRVLYTSLGTAASINPNNSRAIDLHSCPFVNSKGRVDPLICEMHAGLIDHVMDEVYGATATGTLHPMYEPGICKIEMEKNRTV